MLAAPASQLSVSVIAVLPEILRSWTQSGMVQRALQRDLLHLDLIALRDYAHDKHKKVDDRPFGGGPGMVLKPEPLMAALAAAKKRLPQAKVVYLSPQGRRLDHALVREMVATPSWIMLTGRYEGIDERVKPLIDREVSLGDFVLTGGEVAAMAVIEAMLRHVPGVLGDPASLLQESFCAGLLDYPVYTRPEELHGCQVPKVLLQGDHQAIARWRHKQALANTRLKRPDLLADRALSGEEQQLLHEYDIEYAARSTK